MRLALALALATLGCRPTEGPVVAEPVLATTAVIAAPAAAAPRATPRTAAAAPPGSVAVDPAGPSALSGSWSGTYLYTTRGNGMAPGGPASVAFFAELEIDSTQLRGSVVEPNIFGDDDDEAGELRATVAGVIGADGVVRFTKRYDGTAGVTQVVEYVGQLDLTAARIEGTWSTSTATGRFVMKRDRPLPKVAFAPG